MNADERVAGSELWQAAREGSADEILRLWDKHGPLLDLEWKDSEYGCTPLHRAARFGHSEACKALIAVCGADVDDRNCNSAVNRNTPLMMAAWNMHVDCVEVLMALGADTNARNSDNKTALDCVRQAHRLRQNSEVVALL